MLISIAIPCYNSAKTLPSVVKEIKETFAEQQNYDYQIILVNDNSPDNTFQVICKLCEDDKKIIGVDLSKNYGQASAQMAAIQYIKGEIAVFMDDDGQHPPQEIFKIINAVQMGNDLVYAHFPQKKHSCFKKITSTLNSKILEATNRKPKGIIISSYFGLSQFAVNSLKKYHSPFPSIGGYLLQITRKIANVEVLHRKRLFGTSNYSFKKLLKLWIQGFTNFSIAPLRLASFIGLFSAAFGIIVGVILVIRKLIDPHIALGYTSTMAAILLIGGLVMLMLGMLGEYIGRIYILLSNMPQYRIRTEINSNGENTDE
ncbi:MAG TPA: glycosyltransferase [Clostridiales bacterium]|nr:glycosyltransferase [Clostridiales bacterium]